MEAMQMIKVLSQLSINRLLKLFLLLLRYPLYALLTGFATVKTLKKTKRIFPNSHSGNGRGNAFRHALWNCLILTYCCKISSPGKVVKWCRKITNLHEELFVNEPLQRAMDIHNNEVGISLFMEMLQGVHRQFFEVSFFIIPLLKKSEEAIVITSVDDIVQGKLVIIEE